MNRGLIARLLLLCILPTLSYTSQDSLAQLHANLLALSQPGGGGGGDNQGAQDDRPTPRDKVWPNVFGSKIQVEVAPGNLLNEYTKEDKESKAVNAIVNAAASDLRRGGAGVSKTVFEAAGTGLDAAVKLFHDPEVGGAYRTQSFNLANRNIHSIIHTIAPSCSTKGSVQDQNRKQLMFDAITNSLNKATIQTGITSMAFPALSVGVFACPAQEMGETAARAVAQWIRNQLTTNSRSPLKNIRIITFTDNPSQIFGASFRAEFDAEVKKGAQQQQQPSAPQGKKDTIVGPYKILKDLSGPEYKALQAHVADEETDVNLIGKNLAIMSGMVADKKIGLVVDQPADGGGQQPPVEIKEMKAALSIKHEGTTIDIGTDNALDEKTNFAIRISNQEIKDAKAKKAAQELADKVAKHLEGYVEQRFANITTPETATQILKEIKAQVDKNKNTFLKIALIFKAQTNTNKLITALNTFRLAVWNVLDEGAYNFVSNNPRIQPKRTPAYKMSPEARTKLMQDNFPSNADIIALQEWKPGNIFAQNGTIQKTLNNFSGSGPTVAGQLIAYNSEKFELLSHEQSVVGSQDFYKQLMPPDGNKKDAQGNPILKTPAATAGLLMTILRNKQDPATILCVISVHLEFFIDRATQLNDAIITKAIRAALQADQNKPTHFIVCGDYNENMNSNASVLRAPYPVMVTAAHAASIGGNGSSLVDYDWIFTSNNITVTQPIITPSTNAANILLTNSLSNDTLRDFPSDHPKIELTIQLTKKALTAQAAGNAPSAGAQQPRTQYIVIPGQQITSDEQKELDRLNRGEMSMDEEVNFTLLPVFKKLMEVK